MIIKGVKYSWTQPACDECFADIFGHNNHPTRIAEPYREHERCCLCGTVVHNGLYVRINPATVAYPTASE